MTESGEQEDRTVGVALLVKQYAVQRRSGFPICGIPIVFLLSCLSD